MPIIYKNDQSVSVWAGECVVTWVFGVHNANLASVLLDLVSFQTPLETNFKQSI